MKESIIVIKSFHFSLQILQLYKVLIKNKEYVISKQLLRCSTSIGANIEEAGAASSKKDFIAKMTIASKEAREARYWLKLLNEDRFLEDYELTELISEINQIISILTKIVKTSQESSN